MSVGVFFGSAALGCLASFLRVKKLEKKRAREVLDRFKDKQIYGVSSNASFFGQESLSMTQIRGNGVLVLTENELFFQMWAPEKELGIKITDITGVEIPRTFLGKTKGKPLLKVLFKNEKGESDSAAWLVNKLSDWQTAMDKIAKTG
jgi:hypothetical protein